MLAQFESTKLPRATDPKSSWFLAGRKGESEPLAKIPLSAFPFQVGRRSDTNLCLPCGKVSKLHAEFHLQQGCLVVVDLESLNGTYVNGKQVHGPTRLQRGDLLQFAGTVFRVGYDQDSRVEGTIATDVVDGALALVQFDRLLNERAVVPNYQPIVELAQVRTVAYEVLARSNLLGLSNPKAMFDAASQLNLECELSRMLRAEGIREGASLRTNLFVNIHPMELSEPGLIDSLRAARLLHADQRITLEIHESTVTDAKSMRELRSRLNDLEIGLAYDDFGAGQTRLHELVEVPPDFLKFDMGLVQGIHDAGEKRQQMLGSLVELAKDLGIATLAEGVERQEELDVCRALGFDLAQGYLTGRPQPIGHYRLPKTVV